MIWSIEPPTKVRPSKAQDERNSRSAVQTRPSSQRRMLLKSAATGLGIVVSLNLFSMSSNSDFSIIFLKLCGSIYWSRTGLVRQLGPSSVYFFMCCASFRLLVLLGMCFDVGLLPSGYVVLRVLHVLSIQLAWLLGLRFCALEIYYDQGQSFVGLRAACVYSLSD